MHIFYCIKLQLLVEQNPVIPNINSGANIILHIYYECINCIYYILYTYLKNIPMKHVLPA